MNKRLKIIIWGTGNYYNIYKNRFEDHDVIALVDSSYEKQGSIIDDRIVIGPEKIQEYEYDFIVILIAQYEDVKIQLKQYGIPEAKIIFPISEGHFNKFRRVKKFQNQKNADILLFSHAMDRRGAPLMLLEMAKILKRNNIDFEVAARGCGDIGKDYFEENISVLEFDDFNFSEDEIKKYFGHYKLLIINTLALSELVDALSVLDVEIVWWLHEEWSAYDILQPKKNLNLKNKRLHVYGVGNRAIQAFKDYYGQKEKIENLQWGIPYRPVERIKKNEKAIFAIIGPVCSIKGQDFILRAVEEDNEKLYSNLEIWLIGAINENDIEQYKKFDCFRIFGEMTYDKLMNLHKKIDVIFSSSRNDTMPVALVEGLMNKEVCLTSSGTGVSDYIEQYKNGVVYESENVKDLNMQIKWILNHKELWDDIGENAFELYKDKYSMEHFEESLMQLVSCWR